MVRVSSEPRRMSPVIGRRSNSFWRAAMVRSRLILIDETDSPPPVNGFREHFLNEFFRAGATAASLHRDAPGSEQRGTDKIARPCSSRTARLFSPAHKSSQISAGKQLEAL